MISYKEEREQRDKNRIAMSDAQKRFNISEQRQLKAALENKDARAYLVKLLYYSSLFQETFTGNRESTDFNLGGQLLGKRILREADEVDRNVVKHLIGEVFDYGRKLKEFEPQNNGESQ